MLPMSLLCKAWKKQSNLCAALNLSLGCLWYDSRLFGVFVDTRSAVTVFNFFGELKIVSQQKMPPRF